MTIDSDRGWAIQTETGALSQGARNTFVDGSVGDGKVGIRVYSSVCNEQDGRQRTKELTRLIGLQSNLTMQALHLFTSLSGRPENRGIHTLKIYSGCKSALQTLQNPQRQSGQSALRQILGKLKGIQAVNGPKIRFRWVPAHSKVKGNERANVLAKLSTTKHAPTPSPHTFDTPLAASHALSRVKSLGQGLRAKTYTAAKGDKYTRDLDRALPGTHTKTLYDHFTRPEATILAQMRTGKCRLNFICMLFKRKSQTCVNAGKKRR